MADEIRVIIEVIRNWDKILGVIVMLVVIFVALCVLLYMCILNKREEKERRKREYLLAQRRQERLLTLEGLRHEFDLTDGEATIIGHMLEDEIDLSRFKVPSNAG